jgi:hypothetical protein
MKNPIPKNNMWVTPANMQELQDMIERLPKNDRFQAYHWVMLTINMCHDAVEQAMEDEAVAG